MPRRMSSRERLERKAAEAAATATEKAEKKAKKKTTKKTTKKATRKKASTRASAADSAVKARLKIVWVVREPGGSPAKTFPYPAKKEAEAEAKRLAEKKGRQFVVQPDKVPMD